MNIQLLYFSGTYNTKYIADSLQTKLESKGHTIQSQSIETGSLTDNYDLLIVGAPIYAGNVPELMLKHMKNHIEKKKVEAIVFTTSAGLFNAKGIFSMANILTKKGYHVQERIPFVMPRNYYFGKYKAHTPEEAIAMIEQANKQMDELVQNIETNQHPQQVADKGVLPNNMLAGLFAFMARFMGRSYANDDTCIACNKCVKQCPTKNITMKNKKLHYAHKCMLCTRCMHGCPVNSISYKKEKYPQYKLRDLLKPLD